MADKYTIQINPQLSASDAQKMEQDLNRRFSNVAKKFGTNLGNSIKNAAKIGTAALAAGVVATLATNPFEKINENLNKTLEKSDNIVTRAGQFGVSTAKFAQLASIAASVGLDVDLALQQFSGALQEAKDFQAGDKTKNPALANFTGEKDIVDAFFAFSKEMQSLNAEERSLNVARIFGDRMGLKLAEFLQIPDFKARSRQVFGKYSPKQVGRSAEITAELEDLQATLKAKRENEEIIRKSRAINRGTILSQDRKARADLARETSQLSQYQIFANLAAQQERMAQAMDEIKGEITQALMPAINKIVEYLPTLVDYARQAIDWLSKVVAAIKKLKFWG